jgi:sulfite exporter TauE/SafE
MVEGSLILVLTAASIGVLHTLLGPDHYLPFIVMSKARGWSRTKTLALTFLCGLGHVLSSVVLGFIGILLGIALFEIEAFEALRGEIAAWLFIIFGFTYFIWGLHRAVRNKPHRHIHEHADGTAHTHEHSHIREHTHVHDSKNITPWILFTIFILGPCEPLIPILMYPASQGSLFLVFLTAATFMAATVSTMLVTVTMLSYGFDRMRFPGLEVWSHAMAGAVIFASGAAIVFLGL